MNITNLYLLEASKLQAFQLTLSPCSRQNVSTANLKERISSADWESTTWSAYVYCVLLGSISPRWNLWSALLTWAGLFNTWPIWAWVNTVLYVHPLTTPYWQYITCSTNTWKRCKGVRCALQSSIPEVLMLSTDQICLSLQLYLRANF